MVGKELVPDDDQGEFTINMRLPRGTSYTRTDEFVKPIEKEVLSRCVPTQSNRQFSRVQQYVGNGNGNFNITMTPLEERTTSQQEMMRRMRAMLSKYKGARLSVSGGTDISGASTGGNQYGGGGGRGGGGGNQGSSNRLQILIQGPDIEQLQIYTTQLMEKVRTINGVVDVDSNFEPTQPELQITVDRARAADLGVNIDSLATNLRTLVGGEEISEFKDGDDQIIVRLRLDEPFRNNPGDDGRPADSGRTRPDRQGQRRRHPQERARPGVHRSLQPAAADFGPGQHRPGAARRGARGGAREGRGAAPEGGLPGGVRRQRADAQRGVQQLHRRASCSRSSSSTWCWRRSSTASSTR